MAKNQDAHLINMLMNLTKPVKHSNRKLVISLKIYRNTFFQMHSQNVNGFGLTELMKILMQIEYNRSGYGLCVCIIHHEIFWNCTNCLK